MSEIGKQLETLCGDAQNEILLVSPFIKAFTLQRLIDKVSSTTSIQCVTRWRLEDILADVTDIEVWLILAKRQGSSLWLHPNLHAKYYRSGDRCLVGSANLTATALGWSPSPNLELLVNLDATDPSIQAFEQELFNNCIQVDQEMFEQIQETIQILKQQSPEIFTSKVQLDISTLPDSVWLPALRNPEDLYIAYTGQGEQLSTASREAALLDLRSLPVPLHLPKSAFEACIGTLLLQKPIVRQVDIFLVIPQRFGAVVDLLTSLPCSQTENFDPDRTWQTLMRWLRYFLPNRYALSIPRHSEVFYRIEHKFNNS